MATAPIPPTKVCTKCSVEKSADRGHFPPVGKGIRPQCRMCWREIERAYFWANREAKRAGKKRQWTKADRQTAYAKLRAWKAANPEKQKAIEARRAEKIKNTPELRAKARERTRKHREKLGPESARRQRQRRQADPERSRAYSRKWKERNVEKARAGYRVYREANPHKVIAHSEKRRARLLEAEGSFTGHDVIALIKAHGRVCYYCSEKLKKFQVDHFIPLSRGGSNWPSNIVISCRACNLSKGAKMPWEWQPDRFREDQAPR